MILADKIRSLELPEHFECTVTRFQKATEKFRLHSRIGSKNIWIDAEILAPHKSRFKIGRRIQVKRPTEPEWHLPENIVCKIWNIYSGSAESTK